MIRAKPKSKNPKSKSPKPQISAARNAPAERVRDAQPDVFFSTLSSQTVTVPPHAAVSNCVSMLSDPTSRPDHATNGRCFLLGAQRAASFPP